MAGQPNRAHRKQARKVHDEEFLEGLYARRPELKLKYEKMKGEAAAEETAAGPIVVEAVSAALETTPAVGVMTPVEAVLQTAFCGNSL